jgi:hypothetical protein
MKVKKKNIELMKAIGTLLLGIAEILKAIFERSTG